MQIIVKDLRVMQQLQLVQGGVALLCRNSGGITAMRGTVHQLRCQHWRIARAEVSCGHWSRHHCSMQLLEVLIDLDLHVSEPMIASMLMLSHSVCHAAMH